MSEVTYEKNIPQFITLELAHNGPVVINRFHIVAILNRYDNEDECVVICFGVGHTVRGTPQSILDMIDSDVFIPLNDRRVYINRYHFVSVTRNTTFPTTDVNCIGWHESVRETPEQIIELLVEKCEAKHE